MEALLQMVEWSQELVSGIDDIDAHRRELVDMVNHLLQADELGKARGEIGKVFRFLNEYVDRHFRIEEDYMSRFGYPQAQDHLSQHQQFYLEFTKMKDMFDRSGSTNMLVIKVQGTLRNWLAAHVINEDKALGDYLKSMPPVKSEFKTFTSSAD